MNNFAYETCLSFCVISLFFLGVFKFLIIFIFILKNFVVYMDCFYYYFFLFFYSIFYNFCLLILFVCIAECVIHSLLLLLIGNVMGFKLNLITLFVVYVFLFSLIKTQQYQSVFSLPSPPHLPNTNHLI